MPLVGWQGLVRKPISEPVSPGRTTSKRLGVSTRAVRAAGLFALIALSAFLAACASLPKGNEPGSEPAPGVVPVAPVTTAGQATYDLYLWVALIAIIVFVLVEGLLLIITLRFRRKKDDDTLPKQTHGNNFLEVFWTLIPALVVTVLFVAVVSTLNTEDATAANPAVTVDVTGFQWQWTFEYQAQGIKETGSGKDGPVMGLPVNEIVHIRLHAADVIHSFYVPQSLFKKDVVPGRTNEFDWQFNQIGTFAGQCAEFCGIGHADMHFTVQVMSVLGEKPAVMLTDETDTLSAPGGGAPDDGGALACCCF